MNSISSDSKKDIECRIEALTPEKRALFELRLKNKGASTGAGDTFSIPKREKQSLIPLSFAQQRLWFLEQFEPNSAVYNISLAIRLEGVLDAKALQQALNGVVSRHESLRTTFRVVNEQPVQDIVSRFEIAMPLVDIQSLPSVQREYEKQRMLKQEYLS